MTSWSAFLLAWAKAHRDKLDHDPAVYQAVLMAWSKGRPVIAAHRQRLRTLIGRIVDEGLVPGPFRVKDEDKAIAVVIDAFQRFAHPFLVQRGTGSCRAPPMNLRTWHCSSPCHRAGSGNGFCVM